MFALLFYIKYNFIESYDPSASDLSVLAELRAKLITLDPRAAWITMTPHRSKTHTIGKRHMHLCMRDVHGKLYDSNMLMYASIHELAHVINPDFQHTPGFYKSFSHLLSRAIQLGLYDPTYIMPDTYCSYSH